MDYFAPKLSPQELQAISAIGLAHMGDAVYELLVRTWLCVHGKATGKELHRATVALVCAPEQARCAVKLLPLLTEEERYRAVLYTLDFPDAYNAGGITAPTGDVIRVDVTEVLY